MNTTALLKLLDTFLADSPKSRGKSQNLNRAGTLAICGLIWWNVRDLPDRLNTLDVRVASIERRMGYAAEPRGAVDFLSSEFTMLPTNRFTFLHK